MFFSFLRHSCFVISFEPLPPNRSKVLRGSGRGDLICRKHASPHLVHFRRLHRGLCGQGAHAYASIDHMDSRARYCRLDYRRRRDALILSAKCRGQISSRRINCFNRWGGSRFVHLAQVQTAAPSRITPRTFLGAPGGRGLPIFLGEIDLDQFDSRLGMRSLALSEL